MKKILSFLMMMTMCLSIVAFPAMAAENSEETIYPDNFDYEAYEAQDRLNGTEEKGRWSYTESTTQSLSIAKKEATAYASVRGYSDKATKIVIYMYIQQLKNGEWTNLDVHRYEFSSWHASKEITYSSCPHGYTYRLKTSYYVYSGSSYEHISANSANFVYN
jgi:hypothetical protein